MWYLRERLRTYLRAALIALAVAIGLVVLFVPLVVVSVVINALGVANGPYRAAVPALMVVAFVVGLVGVGAVFLWLFRRARSARRRFKKMFRRPADGSHPRKPLAATHTSRAAELVLADVRRLDAGLVPPQGSDGSVPPGSPSESSSPERRSGPVP